MRLTLFGQKYMIILVKRGVNFDKRKYGKISRESARHYSTGKSE